MLGFVKYIVTVLAFLQVAIASIVTSTTVEGKIDLKSVKSHINRKTLNRISVHLEQIYEPVATTESSVSTARNYFSAQTSLQNKDGDFQFPDVTLDLSSDFSYYVLSPKSLDFNLQPNRILIKVQNNDTSITQYFGNVFGREFFPSPEILYPEELPVLKTLIIRPVAEVPIRKYVHPRKMGFMKSGPLASIFQSKWKTGALLAVIFSIALPYLMEKFDPETAKAIREEKAKQQRNKFNIPAAKK